MRLKSCAGARATARWPSHTASTLSSGPVRPSSMTTVRPASPNASPERYDRTASRASASDSVTTTPLPAASPSVFTTYSPDIVSRNASAGATSVNVPWAAVGTPASTRTCFIHAFEPSSSAPSAPGPKTRRPVARSRSARPSTSGASGPITKRSASRSSAGVDTEPGMPGLPGVTTTSALRPSTCARACSRPPLPTTTTRLMRRSGGTDRDPVPRRRGGPGHRPASRGMPGRPAPRPGGRSPR